MSPGDLAALLRRAQEHLAQGRLMQATADYALAAQAQPGLAQVHFNLGVVLYAQGDFEGAAASHRRAIVLKADFPEALASLGSALSALGRWEESREAFERAIAQRPGYADAHSNLGLVHEEQGRMAEARASFERALQIDPAHGEAIHNLGFLLDSQGRTADAVKVYEQALAADPRMPRTAYSLGLAHLRLQDFERGWPLAEARFDTVPPMTPRRLLGLPAFTAADWDGGHRIALWLEQGLGDQLLYSTLLPDLEARGEDFVVEVDPRLAAAFRRAHPGWKVATPHQSTQAFAACDRQLALASLGGLLRPTVASFGAQAPSLLTADPARVAGYRARLGEGPVVGISWRSFQSRTRGRVARDKSAPLSAFSALSRRVRLLDLQYGETAAERAGFERAGARLERFADLDLFNDIEGVLAAIEACESVVTTSNVTAHLAGALGKPAMLVHVGVAPFHYWVAGPGGRSLWYPSVEVRGFESWEQALEKVDGLIGR